MARKRVSGGAVIVKKKEKVSKVIEVMGDDKSLEKFIQTFIELYPKEWDRINKKYKEHEKLSKGKNHPMPNPYKYLENTYKTYIKK